MSAYHYDEISEKLRTLPNARPNWVLGLGILFCLFFWAGLGAVARFF
jgi:hypothetical protein